MNVLEAIQRSADFLARKGVDSPRLQSELLLAHVLRLPRLGLYLEFARALTEIEVGALRELVKRRGQREPLQHLVGSVSFCGLEITVSPDVLIPRPETELLAERAWEFLRNRTSHLPVHPRILDYGTGSGCLAVGIAVKCPAATVVAVDISPAALEVARSNATRHRVCDRICLVASNGLGAFLPNPVFDLLVANPPYIPTVEIASLQPEVRDFDPRIALDGGTDGLDFYRRLADEAIPCLKPGAWMMLEFGDRQADALEAIFRPPFWEIQSWEKDDTQRVRFLFVRLAYPE